MSDLRMNPNKEHDKTVHRKRTLYEVLRASPLVGARIDFDRDRNAPDRATPLDFDELFGQGKPTDKS